MTNKEIVSYFVKLLKEKGIDKRPYYPRLMQQMKTVAPLFAKYDEDDTKKICELIVEHYESWGSNTQYPLEANVVARKWVVERAAGLLIESKKETSRIEERNVVASERNKKAISSIMDRIKKKGGQTK